MNWFEDLWISLLDFLTNLWGFLLVAMVTVFFIAGVVVSIKLLCYVLGV